MILTLVGLYVIFTLVFLVSAKKAPMGIEDEAGFRLATAEECTAKVVPLVAVRRARTSETTTLLS